MTDEEMLLLIRAELGGSTRIETAMLGVAKMVRDATARHCASECDDWEKASNAARAIRRYFGIANPKPSEGDT